MLAILTKLSPNVDKKTISLLYMYYGSDKQYDDSYTLTIEKLIDYLNKDILNDSRFDEFIDDEMRNKIIDSKDRVEDAKALLVGDKHSRMLFITEYGNEGKATFNFIKDTRNDLKKIDDKYLIGNSPMAYDISKSFDKEFNFISLLTLASIFVVVALTFKSIISPLIISLIIQCSVYVTMGILAFQGDPVYFISLLVVQSILMGATIDYGIVFTSYYLEIRKDHNVKDALSKAYQKSSHTIFTSGTILILVTFTIGLFADGVVSKICMTLSKGTICSVVLIILILPGVMTALDRIIVKHRKITK
jgi:predicted RND superfamily exporter protein